MNRVASIEDLDAFFKKYFLKNTLTNNYVLVEAYSQLIYDGRLYFCETNSNIFFLIEENSYFKLYYLINDTDEDIKISSDKPVTMEIVYRGPLNKPNNLINFWERNGFKQHLTRDNLSLTYGKVNQIEVSNPKVHLKYAENIEDARLIKNLFESSLDKYTGDLLSISEVFEFVKKKNIICAYINIEFCGALQFEIKNNIIWLGHIVTDPNYRGNGIANLLVKKYIEDNALSSNSKYQLWVIDDNIAAKSIYNKFGFLYTNKSTTSLLKF